MSDLAAQIAAQLVAAAGTASASVIDLLGFWVGTDVPWLLVFGCLLAAVVGVAWAVGRQSLVEALFVLAMSFAVLVPAVMRQQFLVIGVVAIIGFMALIRRPAVAAAPVRK